MQTTTSTRFKINAKKQTHAFIGGAVAEWSKALLRREKINESQKIPGSPPGPGHLKKKSFFH